MFSLCSGQGTLPLTLCAVPHAGHLCRSTVISQSQRWCSGIKKSEELSAKRCTSTIVAKKKGRNSVRHTKSLEEANVKEVQRKLK